MGIQQEKGGFALRSAISAVAQLVASFWKPMLVAAPLIGTALFFASGTQAQTSGSAAPSATTSANGPVAPEAARTGRPKIKTKTATNGRLANPPPTTDPATTAQTTAPIAPIDAPDAARTGRPKVRDKTPMDTSRVENPTPATEPVAAPVAERTGRPKERDPTPTNDRVANPTPAPTEKRRKGPKVRDDPVRDTSRTGRPKERDDSVRTHTKRSRATTPSRGSNLLLPALGGAAAIAAIIVATSGNDRPASP